MASVDLVTVAPLPEWLTLNGAIACPDEQSFVYYGNSAGQYHIWWPGGTITQCRQVSDLVLTDAAHAACKIGLDDGWAIALDGAAVTSYAWVDYPHFSPAGTVLGHWAELSQAQNVPGYWVAVDGRQFGPFPVPGQLIVKDDGGFVASSNSRGDGGWVMIDGRLSDRFDRTGRIAIAPHDSAAWYWAQRGDQWLLFRNFDVVDRADHAERSGVPAWDTAGRHCAYWRVVRGQSQLVLDGHVVSRGARASNFCGQPRVTRDGNVAAAVIDGDGALVQVNGMPGPVFDAVGRPVLTDDAVVVAYKARRGDREFLVANHAELCSFDVTDHGLGDPTAVEDVPAISVDGARVACAGEREGRAVVAIDRQVLAEVDYVAGGPEFEPTTGQLMYCVVEQKREMLFVEQQQLTAVDRIWPNSASNSETVRWSIPRVNANGRMVFGATCDRTLYWYLVQL